MKVMNQNASRPGSAPKLTKSGISRLFTVAAGLIVMAAIFFGAAGTLDVPRAWIYYGGILSYLVISLIVLFIAFPGVIEVINERGRMKKDVKGWDKIFGFAYALLMFILPAVAGFDAGRFHGSYVPVFYSTPALAMTILAYAFVHWAMIVNKYAETGVRIQTERHQEVVSSGPYRFVRHPFYVSVAVTHLLYPVAVGSLYGYIPALMSVGLLVWRTAKEDAMLQAELSGYAEYASRVRYRLLPGVW